MPTSHDESSTDERLVRRCLELIELGGKGAEEEILAAHPEHAERVRGILGELWGLGLLEESAEPLHVPERMGEFRLVRRIGGGGMGEVYLATQASLGRQVAVKILRPESLCFSGSVERFRREVEALSRLQHPNIVPVHAAGEQDGIPWIAMELIDGCSLADALLELRGRRPEELTGNDLADAVWSRAGRTRPDAASVESRLFQGGWVEVSFLLCRDVARALSHAHERGVIHRDVKPSNIAVTTDGRVHLFDFGLAAFEQGASPLTRSGSQPGSLPYMSPEQIAGRRDVDRRTDVYSLGVTLYEMLTLRQAFDGDTSEEVRRRIERGLTERLRALNSTISKDAETVCLYALEADRERRYATSEDLARDLTNVLELRPIAVRRANLVLRFRRCCMRHPTRALLLGLFLVAALGIPSVALVQRVRDEREVSRLLAEARALQDQGLLDQAIAVAGRAAGVRPDHAETSAFQQRLAQRSKDQAQRALDEILRLSDVLVVRNLIAETDELWPALPERMPACDAWLRRALEIYQSLGGRRSELAAVEARVREVVDPAVASSEQRGLAWQHQLLKDLVVALEALPEVIASVRNRVAFAGTILERSVTSRPAAAAWKTAIEGVVSSPHYGGLVLAPQIGLFPIGPNAAGLWEFLHLQSSGELDLTDLRATPMTSDLGLVFVLVPGGIAPIGSYPVSAVHPPGSPHADPGHRPNEGPVQDVRLDPFFLSKYEMTQAQWRRATGKNPSTYRAETSLEFMDDHPVESVSWTEGTRVLRQLDLELHTEAQWEYACRAGTTTRFSSGETAESLRGYANLFDVLRGANSNPRVDLAAVPEIDDSWDGHTVHSKVGTFGANPWGLHDMHGNVWEWCRGTLVRITGQDTLVARPGDGLRDDGLPFQSGVARGGSFANGPYYARSALRSGMSVDSVKRDVGLRPARSIR